MEDAAIKVKKARGEDAAPLVDRQVHTDVTRTFLSRIEYAQNRYKNGNMNSADFVAALTAAKGEAERTLADIMYTQQVPIDTNKSSPTYGQAIGPPSILLPESFITDMQARINSIYTQAGGTADDLSQVTRQAEYKARLGIEARDMAAAQYPDLVMLLDLAPSEFATFVTTKYYEAAHMLASEPIHEILGAAQAGSPLAMQAKGLLQQDLSLAALKAAQDAQWDRLSMIKDTLAALARNEPVQIPRDVTRWPIYEKSLRNVAEGPNAPTQLKGNAVDGLVKSYLGFYEQSRQSFLKAPYVEAGTSAPAYKAYEQNRVFARPWLSKDTQAFFAARPDKRNVYVENYHLQTDSFINDVFSFGFAGGSGALAKNITFYGGEFAPVNDQGASGAKAKDVAFILNAEAEICGK